MDYEYRSTNGIVPAGLVELPTAVQTLAVAHDTRASPLFFPPAASAVRWIVQLVPFQRSASGVEVPSRRVSSPTAVQTIAVGQDTPRRWLFVPRPAPAVGWIVQLTPFQRSASVRAPRARNVASPTATQTVVDAHEMPSNSLFFAPAGCGVSSMTS